MKFLVKAGFVTLALINLVGYGNAAFADEVDRADRRAQALAPRAPKTIFNEAEAKDALSPGEVEIKSVLVNCYGRGIACIQGSLPVADTKVFLFPYTAYTQELIAMEKQRMADIKKNAEYNAVQINMDDRYFKYMLVAKTDEFGRYSFKGMKPGKYYVLAGNVTGHRTVVGHYYDEFGYDHPQQVDSPADLEFSKVLEITQTSGVFKFDSKMQIFKIRGLK